MQNGKGKSLKARRHTARLAGALRVYGVAVLSLALASMLMLAAWHMFGRFRVAEAGAANAKQQLAAVEAQKAQVEHDLKTLSTPQGTEGALRQQYGVAKPGEGVIEIVQSSSTATTTAPAAHAGFFARLWHALISW